jgi:hypothetical protein
MVLNVPQSMLVDHAAMYWFELRQQFGSLIAPLAFMGVVNLAATQPRRAVLLVVLYAGNLLFAFSYNVGDAHVFYLPSHLLLAILAIASLAPSGLKRVLPRHSNAVAGVAATLLGFYALARAYHDFPALDRSRDARPTEWLQSFTAGLDERRQVFLVDLGWQPANGLSYFTQSVAPNVLVARMRDVLLYAPAFILDNLASERDIVVDRPARRLLAQSYGPLFTTTEDASARTLDEIASMAPRSTRYVLCLLKPTRDYTIDENELSATIRALTGGREITLPLDRYAALAGLVGEPPALVADGERPFVREIDLLHVPVEIRMDSWLNADTIRRMGFGHVVAAHRHALIVERGLSLTFVGADGAPITQAYSSNIFAKQPRYLVRTGPLTPTTRMVR